MKVKFNVGLYHWAEAERLGPPEPTHELANDEIPSKQVVLYLELAGDPGAYVLSTNIKAYTEQPSLEFGMDDLAVTIKKGGICRVRIPYDLRPLPMGMYRVILSLNGVLLTEWPFTIGHPPSTGDG